MNGTDKGYIGMGMEGPIASWYAKITAKDINRHQGLAKELAGNMPPGSRVLEVAPDQAISASSWPNWASFKITGLDISKSFVEIARQNAAAAGVQVDFRAGECL